MEAATTAVAIYFKIAFFLVGLPRRENKRYTVGKKNNSGVQL